MIDLTPRFAEMPPTVLAGLASRYTLQTNAQIPALWDRFVPYLGKIPGQIGDTTYGVCYAYHRDGSFQYLCGVQVEDSGSLPQEFATVDIPALTYAVFSHTDHISSIGATWQAICDQWLPASGCTLEGEPNFELYTEQFDPRSGTGLVEIWIALKAGNVA